MMDNKLFCDCKTDTERRDFFASGKAAHTGVIAPALEPDIVGLYDRISALERELAEARKDREKYMKETSVFLRDRNELVDLVKVAYRKHHLDDPSVGWNELGERMQCALCNVLGDDGFEKFLESERRSR